MKYKNWEQQFHKQRTMPRRVKPWKSDPDSYACVLPYAVYLEYGGEPLPPGTWGVEIIGKRIIPLRDVEEPEDA